MKAHLSGILFRVMMVLSLSLPAIALPTAATAGAPRAAAATAGAPRALAATAAAPRAPAAKAAAPRAPAATDCDGIPSSQCQALIALYNSTNGSSWANKTGWLSDNVAPCSWWGVTCQSGSVQDLNLAYNELSGTLPAELGNLPNLQELDLDENQIGGSIPSALGSVTTLQRLRLYENQLSGSIPAQLGNLGNLTDFEAYDNSLSGSIPPQLAGLSSLQELLLSSNQLTGTIPAQLGSMTKLSSLGLGHNQLSGSIPPQLGSMTGLVDLDLEFNQLSGSIPAQLGSLSNLKTLMLDENLKLSGSIPSQLGNLTNLTWLQLDTTLLSGPMPLSLDNLKNLGLFYFPSTVCEPVNATFETWFSGIEDRSTAELCATGVIDDLAVAPGAFEGEAVLSWSSPASNVASYDLRYSESAITEDNFADATQANPEPGVSASNTLSYTLSDLTRGTVYYFAIEYKNTQGNVSDISDVPVLLDGGFRPDPNGYSFSNYGDIQATDLTTPDLQHMFGTAAVCAFTLAGVCVPRFEAGVWGAKALEAMENGHCEGMSVTAIRFFLGLDNPDNYQTGAQSTYTLLKANIRRAIAHYFSLQFTQPIMGLRKQALLQSPSATLGALEDDLSGAAPAPPNLEFFESGSGGHAITPYAVSLTPDGTYVVWVYDNNQPFDGRQFLIDASSNS